MATPSSIVQQYCAKDFNSDEYKAWEKEGKLKGEWVWHDAPKGKKKKRTAPPQPTGSWKVRIRLKGIVKTKHFKKYSHAKEFYDYTVGEIQSGTYGTVKKDSKQSLNELIDEYIAHSKLHNKQSLWNELEYIDFFRSQPFSKKPFSSVTTNDLQEMVARMQTAPSKAADKRPLKWSTINRRLSSLSAVFQHGIKTHELTIPNPMDAVERPKEDKSNPSDSGVRDRLFIADEKERFYEASKLYSHGYMYFLSAFAEETAIRKAELIGMSKKVKVGDSYVVRKHDGLIWGMIKFNDKVASLSAQITKSGVARDVPLSPTAIRILHNLVTKLGRQPEPNEKVFPVTQSAVKKGWERTLKKAEMKDFIFHDLRHVSLTRWSKHVTMLELMKIAGHTKIQTTARYYSEDAAQIALKLASIEEALNVGVNDKQLVGESTCEKCGHKQAINVKEIMKQVMKALG